MPKVKVLPHDVELEIDPEKDLLTALREKEIYIKSSCGGHASCSDCLIKVVSGDDNINTPSFEESKLIGNVFHITKERLACQTKITGEVSIDVSMHNKNKDEQKILDKTRKNRSQVKLKKSSEVEEKSDEKEKDDSWYKHWEKKEFPDKKGGGGKKRPKRPDYKK